MGAQRTSNKPMRHLAPTHHRYTNFGCWQGFFRRFCNLSAETQKLRSFRNFVMETLELNWPTASLRVRGINTPSTPPLQLSWPNFVLITLVEPLLPLLHSSLTWFVRFGEDLEKGFKGWKERLLVSWFPILLALRSSSSRAPTFVTLGVSSS
jgi:hypothetical protein